MTHVKNRFKLTALSLDHLKELLKSLELSEMDNNSNNLSESSLIESESSYLRRLDPESNSILILVVKELIFLRETQNELVESQNSQVTEKITEFKRSQKNLEKKLVIRQVFVGIIMFVITNVITYVIF